ncbi:probable LRR receptor-like serine/threonine-protein kinase At1g63430 [Impatiens glandulifera]|uniref:probable LRR receptor-like serine/threonine-protein kinase At1g63430 n=1 Tax=Impatiens glandulifera TaxID=253017 RepID=UPI001FB0F09D|nr:probable LRR receptor-like serine/threonine-protein kinase At1g63430 [Impatiens glandulifera]
MKRFASFHLTILLYAARIIISHCSSSLPQDEIYALTRFKESISEDSTHALLTWNRAGLDPCDWPSVTCYATRDHVQKLEISWASLKGFIAPELGKLSHLQDLILHGNKLTGIIPKEFGSLKYLRILDLGMNQLTGAIPMELWSLTNLEKINLQSNGLTGKLPSELTKLSNLTELRLDRNKLEGSIPGSNQSDSTENNDGKNASNLKATGSCCTSQLKVADFSYNFFTGSIIKCLACLPITSFQGNCLQDKNVKQRPPEQCVAPQSRSHPLLAKNPSPRHREDSRLKPASKPTWILAVEIVTGTMTGSIFLVAVLTAVFRYKSKSTNIIHWKKSASDMDHLAIYIDTEMLKDVTKFSRQELEIACEDFSNIIGSSQDSQVYKGNLKGGPEIAVISICIKEDHWASYLELYFQREVAELARLNHENIGKLLGYCSESSPFTRMLVFEYASNGTLYEHLHYGEGCQFSWTRRMKIIIGIARGLKYLHNDIDLPFTISELNSTAVYLTDDFSPKLVDFESWKSILSSSENNSVSMGNKAGPVCLLPNSLEARYLNVEGNVYAFGILLLEIITGKPPYCQDKLQLVEWAKDYMEKPEMMSNLVDPEIKHFKQEDLEVVCEAVSRCIYRDPSKRASMEELCSLLEKKIDTSVSAELQSSSLAWAELALSPDEFHS